MKRSSFFKSLITLAAAPSILAKIPLPKKNECDGLNKAIKEYPLTEAECFNTQGSYTSMDAKEILRIFNETGMLIYTGNQRPFFEVKK